MKLAIGSDHAGLELKSAIVEWLRSTGHNLKDFGTFGNASVDYSQYGFAVGEAVARNEFDSGLLFCGTGVGICIASNKVRGIRAVVCSEPYSAKLSRAHNDANVLALGARVVGLDLARMIIEVWLDTSFEGGRHAERLEKIRQYEWA